MKTFCFPLLLALLVCGADCAQTVVHPQFHAPNQFPEDQVIAAGSPGWVKEANKVWTGDNKPYSAVRSKIEAAIHQGQSADDLRQQYGITAQQKPNDALAQFAWGYAARIASLSRTITTGTSDEDLAGVPEALAHVPDPHTYDFYRLRFLLMGGTAMLPLSKRLLKVNPVDIEVRIQIVNIHCNILHSYWIYPEVSPKIRDSSLADCNRLIEAYPQNPSYQALLGDVYFASWTRSHDKADRVKAATAYTNFLKMSPPSDKRLGNAQYLLKLLATAAKSD